MVKFKELMERIGDIIGLLEKGLTVNLEYIVNQYGETIVRKQLKYNPKTGIFKIWEINCLNSAWFDLGTCQCVSHSPSIEYEISFEEALEKIQEYLEEGIHKDIQHIKNKELAKRLLNKIQELKKLTEEEENTNKVENAIKSL